MTERSQFALRNRQKIRPVNLPWLRRCGRAALELVVAQRPFELCLHLVESAEMARLNEQFLGHRGPTDVITFSHAESPEVPGSSLEGEIFVCLNLAVAQARQYRTTWPLELMRYFVHGLLHLSGYDDHEPEDRRRMKREEDRVLNLLGHGWDLGKIRAASRQGFRQTSRRK